MIKFDMTGMDEFKRKTGNFVVGLGEARELLHDVVDNVVRPQIRRTFAEEGRNTPAGEWDELGPQQAAVTPRGGILHVRGELEESLLADDAKYALSTYTDDEATLGTQDPGAKSHQFGRDDIGEPARPFLGEWEFPVKPTEKVMRKWVNRQKEEAFGG